MYDKYRTIGHEYVDRILMLGRSTDGRSKYKASGDTWFDLFLDGCDKNIWHFDDRDAYLESELKFDLDSLWDHETDEFDQDAYDEIISTLTEEDYNNIIALHCSGNAYYKDFYYYDEDEHEYVTEEDIPIHEAYKECKKDLEKEAQRLVDAHQKEKKGKYYYDIVEDSYEFEDGLLCILYEESKDVYEDDYELEHFCFNVKEYLGKGKSVEDYIGYQDEVENNEEEQTLDL